jgi:hypothetical protein
MATAGARAPKGFSSLHVGCSAVVIGPTSGFQKLVTGYSQRIKNIESRISNDEVGYTHAPSKQPKIRELTSLTISLRGVVLSRKKSTFGFRWTASA